MFPFGHVVQEHASMSRSTGYVAGAYVHLYSKEEMVS